MLLNQPIIEQHSEVYSKNTCSLIGLVDSANDQYLASFPIYLVGNVKKNISIFFYFFVFCNFYLQVSLFIYSYPLLPSHPPNLLHSPLSSPLLSSPQPLPISSILSSPHPNLLSSPNFMSFYSKFWNFICKQGLFFSLLQEP